MPTRISTKSGSELFIVDNSNEDWKAIRYLRDWCDLSKAFDIATGNFEIGSLLALDGDWQKVDQIRILIKRIPRSLLRGRWYNMQDERAYCKEA